MIADGSRAAVFELLKISWGVENFLSIPDTYEVISKKISKKS